MIRRLGSAALAATCTMLMAGCAAESAANPSPTPSATPTQAAAVEVPLIDIEPLPEPEPGPCDAGSLLTVWAHYDDDLIFGHSEIAGALREGHCVTIAYLTAGDAGRGIDYSRNREGGIRDAYDALLGMDGEWTESTDAYDTGVTTTSWTPADSPNFTITSFRLVDGNIDGSGFESVGWESLAKLADGRIDTIRDVDGPEHLTRDQITATLIELFDDADPTDILTHIPAEAADLARADHSDHSAVGSFVRAAWRSADIHPGVVDYAIGYQTSDYPVNVEGDVLVDKVRAFSAYAVRDAVTASCQDLDSCLSLRLFGGWLQREYAKAEAELGLD